MGSLIGGVLGGSSSSTKSTSGQALPLDIRGSRGSRININNGIGDVRLTRGLVKKRDKLFSDIQGITRNVQDDILSLRSLENPFIRARVRPTEERFASLRSDVERNLGRRSVAGTFGTNELLRVDDAASKEIADQTALAQGQMLDAVLQRQSFLSRLNEQLSGLNQQEINQALSELGLGSQSVANLVRQTSSETENEDTGKGLQTAASLAGAAAAFFSDRRLKKNITMIGHADFPLYQFQYIWGDDYFIGYMADEVEEKRPDAVFDVGGFKAVDYGAL